MLPCENYACQAQSARALRKGNKVYRLRAVLPSPLAPARGTCRNRRTVSRETKGVQAKVCAVSPVALVIVQIQLCRRAGE